MLPSYPKTKNMLPFSNYGKVKKHCWQGNINGKSPLVCVNDLKNQSTKASNYQHYPCLFVAFFAFNAFNRMGFFFYLIDPLYLKPFYTAAIMFNFQKCIQLNSSYRHQNVKASERTTLMQIYSHRDQEQTLKH